MKPANKHILSLYQTLPLTGPDELYVSSRLAEALPKRQYKILNDVLVPTKTASCTAQIDHIVVSIFGIFCLETKGHQGWIIAANHGRTVTQILFKKRYELTPNPFTQNSHHIRALSAIIGSSLKQPIVSLIVFPSADRIIAPRASGVGSTDDTIRAIQSYKKPIYSYQEAAHIIQLLAKNNQPDEYSHQVHNQRLQQLQLAYRQ